MTAGSAKLYSSATAQDVLLELHRLLDASPLDYYTLEMISFEDKEIIPQGSLKVRLDPAGGKTTIADGDILLHCFTDDGIPVDIFLGTPDVRDVWRAEIRLGA